MENFKQYIPSPEEIKEAEKALTPEQKRMSGDREREYSKHEKDIEESLEGRSLDELKETYEFLINQEEYGKLEVPDWVEADIFEGRGPLPGSLAYKVWEEIKTKQLRSSIIKKFVEERLGKEEAERIEKKVRQGIRRYKKRHEIK